MPKEVVRLVRKYNSSVRLFSLVLVVLAFE